VYRIEFPEEVHRQDLAEMIGRAMVAAKTRCIKGRWPVLQYRPDRPGVTRKASVWYLLKCGTRYIDVLAGVLAGEGYLVSIEKMKNPWEDKKPTLPEDQLPVRSSGSS
jgi:hypothetical protein